MQEPCKICGAPVEVDPEFTFDVPECRGVVCDDCIRATTREAAVACSQKAWLAKWDTICPDVFKDTDLEMLPYPEKSREVLHYPITAYGLNLWGFPDTGKTRTMFLVLKKMHEQRKTISVFVALEFAKALEEHNWKRGPWIERLCQVDVLAFDDFDKIHLSKDHELIFFGILDRRLSSGRPVLFTHNSTAANLEYQFRTGEPLVRRIRQFTKAFHFPERTML